MTNTIKRIALASAVLLGAVGAASLAPSPASAGPTTQCSGITNNAPAVTMYGVIGTANCPSPGSGNWNILYTAVQASPLYPNPTNWNTVATPTPAVSTGDADLAYAIPGCWAYRTSTVGYNPIVNTYITVTSDFYPNGITIHCQ